MKVKIMHCKLFTEGQKMQNLLLTQAISMLQCVYGVFPCRWDFDVFWAVVTVHHERRLKREKPTRCN